MNLRLPKTNWPPLQKAVAQYERLREEQNVTQARVYDLARELEDAREKDRQAYAKAIAAGEGDPGTPAEGKTQDELHNAQRRLEALALAVKNAEQALAAVVEANRDKWAGEASDEAEQARQELADAVEKLAAANERHAERRALVAWLSGFPEQASIRVVAPPIRGLPRPSGEAYFVSDVLDALRAAASAEAASPEAKRDGLYVASRGGEKGTIATGEVLQG